jgi:predicted nucleic acid-binding protein
MKLLDTNIPIAATTPDDPFHRWAKETVLEAIDHGGAGLNAVSLAELCAHTSGNFPLLETLEGWGVEFLDVPHHAARICGAAYARYCANRKASGSTPAPRTPLPDFLIGAHAEALGLELVTADARKFKTYFPNVKSEQPPVKAAAAVEVVAEKGALG